MKLMKTLTAMAALGVSVIPDSFKSHVMTSHTKVWIGSVWTGFWTTLIKLFGKKTHMVHLFPEGTLPELIKSQLIRFLSTGAASR